MCSKLNFSICVTVTDCKSISNNVTFTEKIDQSFTVLHIIHDRPNTKLLVILGINHMRFELITSRVATESLAYFTLKLNPNNFSRGIIWITDRLFYCNEATYY